jgi:hypothetical protein
MQAAGGMPKLALLAKTVDHMENTGLDRRMPGHFDGETVRPLWPVNPMEPAA